MLYNFFFLKLEVYLKSQTLYVFFSFSFAKNIDLKFKCVHTLHFSIFFSTYKLELTVYFLCIMLRCYIVKYLLYMLYIVKKKQKISKQYSINLN